MKKKNKIIIIITGILLLIGVVAFARVTRVRNVFDEMYYTRVHRFVPNRIFITENTKNPRGLFANMPQLGDFTWDYEAEKGYVEEKVFFECYEQAYLKENESLRIYIDSDEKILYFDFYYDERNWYSYYYYVKQKCLVYDSNDPENAEGCKDFLYESFLPDWFAANEQYSRYSLEDLGEFEFWDETEQGSYE